MPDYRFEAQIQAATIGKGGAYVACPFDLRAAFWQGPVESPRDL